MSFHKKTIKDIELSNKTVLLRVDYNVPMDAQKIREPYRIEQSIPTIEYLLGKKTKIVICSHLGRPTADDKKNLSLKPVAEFLSKKLKREVIFIDDCVGDDRDEIIENLRPGQIVLLENLRFYKEEEENESSFAKALASKCEVFVQDAFGVVHRKHASVDAITKIMPSVAGLLLEKEVTIIEQVLSKPERPLTTIVGGAKIKDKIDILKTFIKTADFVAIGGAMANTFLDAKGVEVGKSLVDDDEIDVAKQILHMAEQEAKIRDFVFYLPQDVVVATSTDKLAKTRIVDLDAHVIADIESYPRQALKSSRTINSEELILDIGPFSGAFIAGNLQYAKTVIWNGLMGVTETPSVNGPIGPFAHGTELILDALSGQYGRRPYSLIGGGDTSTYIEHRNLMKCFNHVSTGGGATLELIAGKKLPGIEALQDK